jgi:serine/threonine-protein kinase
MSPEQASGRPVDAQSDQFAFGLLTYEMLSGRQAFDRPSVVETLAAIVRDEPVPLGSVCSDLPEPFGRVIARCLSKLPKDRFESSRDLVLALAACDPRGTHASSGVLLPAGYDVLAPARPAGAWSSRRVAVAGATAALLVVAVTARLLLKPATPPPPIESMAVLPFESGSGPDAQYLADGVTDSLIAQMSRVPSLRVMARGTVTHYRGTGDPQAAGRRLNVAAVVTGRVARQAERLSVSAELIEVATGVRLWGNRFEAPFVDVLRVQDAVATNIAEALRLRLSSDAQRSMAIHGTNDPFAYELLLKGRYLMTHDTEEDDTAARELFRKALARDPRFLDARLEVATTYIRSAGNLYAPPTDAWARAEEEIQAVLAVDPENFRARVNRAVRHFMFDWDWAKAEQEFARLSADPRLYQSNAYHPLAIYSWVRGRTDEAVAVMERALLVDPENTESKVMRADLLAQAGRLDDAVAQFTAIAAAAPDDSRPLFALAELMKRRGQIGDAIAMLRKACEHSDDPAGIDALTAARTEADYEAAEVAIARARLDDHENRAKTRYVSPLDLARLHAQVGNREQAFQALALAVAERSPGLVHLKVDRAWDHVRADPRFAAIVRQVGIP